MTGQSVPRGTREAGGAGWMTATVDMREAGTKV